MHKSDGAVVKWYFRTGPWLVFSLIMWLLALCLFAVAQASAQTRVAPAAAEYKHLLLLAAKAHTPPRASGAPVATYGAQVQQESGWRPDARSKYAQGLTQFTPATAADIARQYPMLRPPLPYDPFWAMQAMVIYMEDLRKQVTGIDECERWAFALSAYNGGIGWVNARKRISPDPQFCLFMTCDINPGITTDKQRQNQDYARRILLTLEPLYLAAGWEGGVCY